MIMERTIHHLTITDAAVEYQMCNCCVYAQWVQQKEEADKCVLFMICFVIIYRQLDNNQLTCVDEAALRSLKELEIL